ncbi:MAG: hypothetical protein WAN87_03470 [Thermoplasmata archaeon]
MSKRTIALVVGVAVVVTFAGLYAVGAFSIHGSSSIVISAPLLPSFAQAYNANSRVVSNVSGGPWTLESVQGIDAIHSESVPSATSLPWGYGCSIVPAGGGTLVLTAPAFTGNLSSGLAAWWGFVYAAPSGTTALLVQVASGMAAPAGLLSGSCPATARLLYSIPDDVVGSEVAAHTAWTQTGADYFANYSSSTESLALLPADTSIPGVAPLIALSPPPESPIWYVGYNGCDAFGTLNRSSQPSNAVFVNATTGGIYGVAGELGGTNCWAENPPNTPFVGEALGLGNASVGTCPSGGSASPGDLGGCAPGDTIVTLRLNASVVNLGGLGLEVLQCTNLSQGGGECNWYAPPSGRGAIAALNEVAQVVASSSFASGYLVMNGTWMSYVSGYSDATTLLPSDTLVVDLGTSAPIVAPGFLVEVCGSGPYDDGSCLALNVS